MKELPDMLLESLRRNGRVNAALLHSLSDTELDLADGQGGWTLGQHLGHLADFRKDWLSNMSPRHAAALPDVLRRSESGFELTTRDLGELAAAFASGDTAAVKAVQDALQEDRAFDDPWNEGTYPSSPAHFLQHIIVHDAHHRGQIMTLLRQHGRSPQQMDELDGATWAVWRE